jgi:hypothetical protein
MASPTRDEKQLREDEKLSKEVEKQLKAKPKKSEVQYFKTTYRLLFASCIISSIFICERFVFPYFLKVTWQGSLFEESLFVALTWFISTFIIGTLTLVVGMFAIMNIAKKTELTDDGQMRPALATQFFSGSLARWFMSLSPCVGPPLALAILSNFYKQQLDFDDAATLAQACLLLGCTSFLLCLPLTLDAQRSLNARVKERFGVNLDDEADRDKPDE